MVILCPSLSELWVQELQESWYHLSKRFASFALIFTASLNDFVGVLVLGVTSFSIAAMWMVSDSISFLLQQDICVVE